MEEQQRHQTIVALEIPNIFGVSRNSGVLAIKERESNNNVELIVSPDHLVFVCRDGCETPSCCSPIASQRVAIGDRVLFINSEETAVKVLTVRSIESIEASTDVGLYAPITSSGTLLVNGILVSQYSTASSILPQAFDKTVHSTGQRLGSLLIYVMNRFRIFTPTRALALLDLLRLMVNKMIVFLCCKK